MTEPRTSPVYTLTVEANASRDEMREGDWAIVMTTAFTELNADANESCSADEYATFRDYVIREMVAGGNSYVDYIETIRSENERLRGEFQRLRKERDGLVSSLNRAEDRWSTLRDRLEGMIETWRRLEGHDPEGVSYALEIMKEIIDKDRTERK